MSGTLNALECEKLVTAYYHVPLRSIEPWLLRWAKQPTSPAFQQTLSHRLFRLDNMVATLTAIEKRINDGEDVEVDPDRLGSKIYDAQRLADIVRWRYHDAEYAQFTPEWLSTLRRRPRIRVDALWERLCKHLERLRSERATCRDVVGRFPEAKRDFQSHLAQLDRQIEQMEGLAEAARDPECNWLNPEWDNVLHYSEWQWLNSDGQPLDVWRDNHARSLYLQLHPPPDRSDFWDPPSGAAVLENVENALKKYVVVPQAAYLVVALWVITTHVFEVFDSFPYLSLTSPTPRCGKTRLLEILELLCARPWRGTAPTEAALFRFIEDQTPTLLLDEVESLNKKNASERDSAVLSILNAGYKRGQTVPRCVGNAHELQLFRVYCPKAFAAIGHLPPALSDRCIRIEMQRRSNNEPVARFRFTRAQQETRPIRAEIEAFVSANRSAIEQAYADQEDLAFVGDREAELFGPLFAVCAVLAPERLKELEDSAKFLSEAKEGDAIENSTPQRLLHDVFQTWPADHANRLSREIIADLEGMPESSWKDDFHLTPRRLARMLRPFDVFTRQVRTDSGVGRGYLFSEVQRAISRYPLPQSETSVTNVTNRINTE